MEPATPITAKEITTLQNQTISLWHEREDEIHSWGEAVSVCSGRYEGSEQLIYDLALINSFQWHEEDKARMVGVKDQFLGEVKKSIDASNQRRTDKIEELDSWFVGWLQDADIQPADEVPMNSETPGSIIDRLCILRLKKYHMQQETHRMDATEAHIEKCSAKLAVLCEQERDLDRCFEELLSDILKMKRRIKIYFQFKMYNDPDTNPAVYTNLTESGATG
jgi:hypothetical protein